MNSSSNYSDSQIGFTAALPENTNTDKTPSRIGFTATLESDDDKKCLDDWLNSSASCALKFTEVGQAARKASHKGPAKANSQKHLTEKPPAGPGSNA